MGFPSADPKSTIVKCEAEPVPSRIDGVGLMLSDMHSASSVAHNGLFIAEDLPGSTRNVC